jgi:Sulfotransferase family
MKCLEVNELMATAISATGLDDWGEEAFIGPLTCLVEAINNEASLNQHGYELARERLLQRLCQRLRLFEDRKRRPEIAAQRIERPIMVVGLPRAGTTYTHSLLGSDPENIAPLGWQVLVPSPPPNDPTIDHSAAIEQARALAESQGWLSPQIKSAHDFNPLHPEECTRAFELSFHSLSLVGYWNIPSYLEVLSGDCTDAYKVHKKVLQALQVGAEGNRWILKAPEHTAQLEYLFKVYPDAMLVQNHRDPSRVMASVMSLIRELQALSTDHAPETNRAFALAFMQNFADAQERLIQIRQDPQWNERFVDVPYLDLERSPMEVMRHIYTRTGMEFNDRSERAIAGWVNNHRKEKHGKHRYRLQDINVTQHEIHEIFNSYIDYFDIELEPAV